MTGALEGLMLISINLINDVFHYSSIENTCQYISGFPYAVMIEM